MHITFKKASPSDQEYLLKLRERTMNRHMNSSELEATKEENLKMVLYKFELANIYLNQEKIGLLKLEETAKEVEIIQIQLEPQHQRKGTGRLIIEKIVLEALKNNKVIKLSVLKQNPALRLYQKIGFKHTGEDEHEFFMRFDKPDMTAD